MLPGCWDAPISCPDHGWSGWVFSNHNHPHMYAWIVYIIQRIIVLAPQVFVLVSKRRASRRTVCEALSNNLWISDIQGALTVGVISEFLSLWDLILQPGVTDYHIWRLSSNGQYSARLAYKNLFEGMNSFRPYTRIWRTWAPGKCKFFLWFVAQQTVW